ncbi:MAG: hypothetical protein JWO97_4377 [Acidobacteria bacterium]|nr:hypothetical protein [Acidobacteriota bacterium]
MGAHFLVRGLLVVTIGLSSVQAFPAATAPEYLAKAAFIYKFATYIRWPTSPAAETPFVIGVLGKDPFGSSLFEVVRNRTVQGRPIVVRELTRAEDAVGCDLVFISSSERDNLRKIFALLAGAPVLTVSDMDEFAELGGLIGLTTEDRHIRFEINKGGIERAGLRASSQLLQLGRIVDEGTGRHE